MPLGVGGNERQLAPHMGPGKHTGAPPLGRAHLQGSPGTLPPPPPPPRPRPCGALGGGEAPGTGRAPAGRHWSRPHGNGEELTGTYMPQNRGCEVNVTAPPHNEMRRRCWTDAQMCLLSWTVL